MRKLKFKKVSITVIGLLALTLFVGCRKTQDAGVFEQNGVTFNIKFVINSDIILYFKRFIINLHINFFYFICYRIYSFTK